MLDLAIRVLVIEDDPGLGRGLSIQLEAERFSVEWQSTLASAQESLTKTSPHLILLDLNLPDGNGVQFLKKLRHEGNTLPIIILTARTDEDSVVDGLQAGATDYVKKPFSQRELLARIRVALRETLRSDTKINYGGLRIDVADRKILFEEKDLNLNRREYDILAYFVTHSETVVTRDALLRLFDKEGEIFDRTIDSHISHIRAKLKKTDAHVLQIASIYGVGYRLEMPEEKT